MFSQKVKMFELLDFINILPFFTAVNPMLKPSLPFYPLGNNRVAKRWENLNQSNHLSDQVDHSFPGSPLPLRALGMSLVMSTKEGRR